MIRVRSLAALPIPDHRFLPAVWLKHTLASSTVGLAVGRPIVKPLTTKVGEMASGQNVPGVGSLCVQDRPWPFQVSRPVCGSHLFISPDVKHDAFLLINLIPSDIPPVFGLLDL